MGIFRVPLLFLNITNLNKNIKYDIINATK